MVKSFNSYNKFGPFKPRRFLTLPMGKAIPVNCFAVLPGDIWRMSSSQMTRMQALISPVFGDVFVRIHHFFVPTRIIFPDWYEKFLIGSNEEESVVVHPTIKSPAATETDTTGGWHKGSLADYLRYPLNKPEIEVSAFKARVYQKIIGDWYINNNIETAPALSTDAGLDSTTSMDLFNVNYPRDYFTGCLPFRQFGPDPLIPLAGMAPVSIYPGSNSNPGTNQPQRTLRFTEFNGSNTGHTQQTVTLAQSYASHEVGAPIYEADGTKLNGDSIANQYYDSAFDHRPLCYHDGITGLADLTGASGISLNTLRTIVQVKNEMEIVARSGHRAVEWLLGVWGVRCSDARLQRSEYLGGSKTSFSVSEVLQTSSTDSETPQGNMAGHGFSAGIGNGFTKRFEEHGYIMTIVSIVPKPTYMDGYDREDMKRTKYEYATPALSHLSEDAVFKGEVYCTGDDTEDKKVFGYRPIYDDYRHFYSTVAGDFRDNLDYWTWARKFASQQSLNKDFIKVEDMDRQFATQDGTHHFLMRVDNFIKIWRKLPKKGLPGLLDHN